MGWNYSRFLDPPPILEPLGWHIERVNLAGLEWHVFKADPGAPDPDRGTNLGAAASSSVRVAPPRPRAGYPFEGKLKKPTPDHKYDPIKIINALAFGHHLKSENEFTDALRDADTIGILVMRRLLHVSLARIPRARHACGDVNAWTFCSCV